MSPRTKEQFQSMQDKTRERILDAGLLLFSRSGLAAVNVTQIAREAGISLGLLYHYFPSKEALFSALVTMAIQGAIKALDATAGEEAQPAVQIHRMSNMVSTTLSGDNKTADYFLLLLQAGLAASQQKEGGEPPIEMTRMAAAFDHLEKWIQAGQREGTVKPGDPRPMAQLYWAAFQGLCLYKMTMRRFAPPEAALLDGILLTEKGCAQIHEL